MSINNKDFKIKTNIDLTSMVDVVMLLVIFFLATTTWAKQPNEIKINLPISQQSDNLGKEKNIVISLNKRGEIYLYDHLTNKEKLGFSLSKALEKEKTRTIVIRGDKQTSYQILIEIMDIAKHSGANNITLQVNGK